LMYANGLEPLEPGSTCKIFMLDVLPGRSRHIEQYQLGLAPTAGFDSHSSANFQEW
jgi:hypothetical protein